MCVHVLDEPRVHIFHISRYCSGRNRLGIKEKMPLTSQGRFRNLYSKLHVLNFIRNPQIPCFRMDGNVMFLWYYSTFFLYFDNPTCSVAFHCHIGNCPGLTTAESCSSDFCWLYFSFVNSYDPTFTEFDCFLETFPVILWLRWCFFSCVLILLMYGWH